MPEAMRAVGERIAVLVEGRGSGLGGGRARRRQDDVRPRCRCWPQGTRTGHVPNVRDRPGSPVAVAAAHRSCTLTPIAVRGWDELEDLDLEATLDQAVTRRRMGRGLGRGAGPDRLEVHIHRPEGADSGEIREVRITPVGDRWTGVDPSSVRAGWLRGLVACRWSARLDQLCGQLSVPIDPRWPPRSLGPCCSLGHVDTGSDGGATRRRTRGLRSRRSSTRAGTRSCSVPRSSSVLDSAGVDRRQLTEIAVGGWSGTLHRVADRSGDRADARARPRHSGARRVQSRRGGARCRPIEGPFAVATDARRQEVYWAAYDEAGRRTAGPERCGSVDGRDRSAGGWRGSAALPGSLPQPRSHRNFRDAGDLAVARGEMHDVPICRAQPIYLRRPDARPPAGRKPVLSQ